MSDFTIIKNSPPPSVVSTRGTYPFGKMEISDAFDAPLILHSRLRAAASSWGKNHGRKFTVRKIDDATLRVWRVA